MEEAAHQRDFGSKQMQTRSDSLGVFTEDTRAFFDDVVDTRVATRCSFKHYRREHRDLVFVRRLCPANKLIKIVQRECLQNFRSELHLTAMQVVLAQDETQRFNGQKITATGVAQNVSPPTSSLDPFASPASYRRTTPRVDHNAVPPLEGRRQAGITIAARHDFRIWPNVTANERERSVIFLSAAASKENSCAVDLFWQLGKNFAQTFRGCQAQIRRRQFSLIENHPLRARVSTSGYSFH